MIRMDDATKATLPAANLASELARSWVFTPGSGAPDLRHDLLSRADEAVLAADTPSDRERAHAYRARIAAMTDRELSIGHRIMTARLRK